MHHGNSQTCEASPLAAQAYSFRFVTSHVFVVTEEGQDVKYEVRLGGILGYVVRRNGVKVTELTRGFARYMMSAGILLITCWCLEILAGIGSTFLPDAFTGIRQGIAYWIVPVAFLGALPLSWYLKLQLQGRDH